MAQVILRDIKKIYKDGTEAVHGLNLHVKEGEFMVLVGPSGCSKTTILRMIAGLEDITSGDLIIGDMRVNNIPPSGRNVAMVFQDYALYPHMSVFNNMAYSLKIRKQPKTEIKKRVMQAVKILGLEDQINKKPKDLSGGQRQRVAVGRVIVREPQVFLFDEPLSNLDAKLRVHMRAEIVNIQKNLGTTMVYVTHDQVEAMTMGDRICVLDKGSIMQVDEPMNIYNNPLNKFVATFIGTPPMNIIRGIINTEYNALFFKAEDMKLKIPEEKYKILQSYVNKEIDLGIRPEHIKLKEASTTDKNYIEATDNNQTKGLIFLIELMGNEKIIHFTIGSNNKSVENNNIIICRTNEHHEVEKGKINRFVFDMRFCHFFDIDTGNNIL